MPDGRISSFGKEIVGIYLPKRSATRVGLDFQLQVKFGEAPGEADDQEGEGQGAEEAPDDEPDVRIEADSPQGISASMLIL